MSETDVSGVVCPPELYFLECAVHMLINRDRTIFQISRFWKAVCPLCMCIRIHVYVMDLGLAWDSKVGRILFTFGIQELIHRRSVARESEQSNF
jgi:hypothetical protein